MASFSFGAGNAGKVLRIPLYLAGRFATLVIPRRRDAWVFGCAVGVADGALALWQAAPRPDAVWLVADAEQAAEAARHGIPAVRRDSPRGFWRTARAGVVVVTHGLGDANRYALGGAFIVQLWHGIPLKRIGLDSPVTLDPGRLARVPGIRQLLAIAYRRAQSRISLLPAASHLVRGRLETAFGLDDARVPVVGEPRPDVLSTGDSATARERARSRIDDLVAGASASRLVLYAPTWRDGAVDPAVPTAAEWQSIIAALERTDAVLLVRSHPLGAGDYTPEPAHPRVRSLGSHVVSDATPLLPGLDVLITDYSSLAYDAGLVPLATLFLAPDLESYERTRGFYGTYADVAGADPARTWSELVVRLETLLGDASALTAARERAAALSERVHDFRDGRNTLRTQAAIEAALAASRGERA